jgi:YD repeat-containing protein
VFTGILALDRTISYNEENRMIEIIDGGTTAWFSYNAHGQRVKKTINTVTTYYFLKKPSGFIPEGNI